jgi:hypothetical protein
MAYSFDELAECERRRWMKPNAHLFMRPGAQPRVCAPRSRPESDRASLRL